MKHRYVTQHEALRIARQHSVKLPRVGYEVSLGQRRWLRSTGHAQFGWWDSTVKAPFEVVCRCDEELRPNQPRGCTPDCPNLEVS